MCFYIYVYIKEKSQDLNLSLPQGTRKTEQVKSKIGRRKKNTEHKQMHGNRK